MRDQLALLLAPDSTGGARFSRCGSYRYELWRQWDNDEPYAVFCMLNPSRADHEVDDPTIRRCISFAKSWGFGGVTVVNLFALRSTDPKGLHPAADPVGPENDEAILRAVVDAEIAIAGWGTHGGYRGRSGYVLDLVRQAGGEFQHLGLTKAGQPRHPLYLPKTVVPCPLPRAAP